MRSARNLARGLLALALLGHAGAAAGAPAPNVLLVVVDDLNCDVACYGAPGVVTPSIDALAAAGMRFSRAYAQGTACHPSRASLLTGRTPLATGVFDNHTDPRARLPDAVTLVRHFRNHGYVTARAGKIAHRGYDDREAWTFGGDFRPVPAPRETTKTQRRERSRQLDRWGVSGPGAGEGLGDYQVADEAIALLGKLQQERFFLAVGFDSTHPPLIAPRPQHDLYRRARDVLPPDFAPLPLGRKPARRENSGLFHARRAEMGEARQMILAYRAVTSFLDTQLGRVLAELDRLGLREKTLVVFVSDHGFHLGEKGFWGKNSLYERGLRVPFILAGPGIAPGGVSERTVQLLDLYPTLVEIARLPSPGPLDGHSLVPLLAEPGAAWPHPAHSWLERDGILGASLRTERYRYTEWDAGSAGRELYDHDADPRERSNLADDPASAETVARLGALLR